MLEVHCILPAMQATEARLDKKLEAGRFSAVPFSISHIRQNYLALATKPGLDKKTCPLEACLGLGMF